MLESILSPSFAHPKPVRRSSLSSRCSPPRPASDPVVVNTQGYLRSLMEKKLTAGIVREFLTGQYTKPRPVIDTTHDRGMSRPDTPSARPRSPVRETVRPVSPPPRVEKTAQTTLVERGRSLASILAGGKRKPNSAPSSSEEDIELPLRRNRPRGQNPLRDAVGTMARTSMRPRE